MGYTHYWRRPQELDASKFKLAIDDCRKVCNALPVPLGDCEGKGQPEFTDNLLSFNGSMNSLSLCKAAISIPWPTDDAEGIATIADVEPIAGNWFAGNLLKSRCCDEDGDGSFESFVLERLFAAEDWDKPDENGQFFACCKTAFRPYDLDVQCCLIVFKEYFGESIMVTSDGTDKQWNEARDVCQHILRYGLLFVLDT